MDLENFPTKITSFPTFHSGMYCTCLHNVLIGCPYAVIL